MKVDIKNVIFLLGFKCEWLSPTSIIYGKNVEFIRKVTHLPNALRFWVKMWCVFLSYGHEALSHSFLPSFLGLPNSCIRAVIQLGGGARVDPGIGSTIACGGNSHLRGRMLSFKCEWLSLTLTMYKKNVEFVREMTQ
jgi:hypothetical protein